MSARACLGLLLSLAAVAAEAPRPPLTSAAAIRSLAPAEASRSLPVRLAGVVINVSPEEAAIVMMTGQEGIFVRLPDLPMTELKPGDWLEVEGITHPGDFAPIAIARALRRSGTRPVPQPLPVTLGEIAAGGFDAHWVEVEGIVRSCTPVPAPRARADLAAAPASVSPASDGGVLGDHSILTLALGNERLRVRLPELLNPDHLVDARVRIRGVCFNVHNANRQFVRASLLASGREAISIVSPPPADPFALPLQRAAELLQFNQAGFSGHRVHVRGVVTRHEAGNALWVRDGERGLRVVSSQSGKFEPGDWVNIAGFVDPGSYSPSLVDAIFRAATRSTPPAPIHLGRFSEAVEHDADLIQIEAELTDLRQTPSGWRLALEWDGVAAEAVLLTPSGGAAAPPWEVGSQLLVSGICALAPRGFTPETGLWQAESIRLLLRAPSDVTVLHTPPWLTSKRLRPLFGGAAAALIGVIITLAVVSRRQNARREAERKMAEAEFAAMLRERNRMARDIHDTLAQGLNAVSMQLELAKNTAPRSSDGMLRHVATAHAIVRSCIAEAREAIWNMRSQVLERTDLAGALDGVLRQLSGDLPCTTRVEVMGVSRRLAPQVENNFLRIGQEAISNAVKHANPSRITVQLEFEAERIRLRVSDDGAGFDVAAAGRVSSRFGLAGIRERVEQLHATLAISSTPGQGTELVVELALPR